MGLGQGWTCGGRAGGEGLGLVQTELGVGLRAVHGAVTGAGLGYGAKPNIGSGLRLGQGAAVRCPL